MVVVYSISPYINIARLKHIYVWQSYQQNLAYDNWIFFRIVYL